MTAVRTRIAPSPTGDPHVGTAYVALFNLCFAKKLGGKFILRIEDTDQTRSTSGSEQAIFDSLRWMGIEWDEGPDVGGEYGPYRQSERRDIYGQYAQELVDKGHAFHCYRTPEELDELRAGLKEQGINRALKPCDLAMPASEIAAREAANAPFVVRMKVPEEGRVDVKDMLRGTMELDWALVDAQILLKSDGMPTYHLANVVDDHLMKITHVLRGEEWINSAPKHQLLYEYFGWDMPELCHLPLLRNPDKTKLSKRKNPTSIMYYQRMGFLPEALLNYLGRMGWSMPDEREKFNLQEMLEHFDIQRVSLGGPIFDVAKLSWLNGLWIRENLNVEQLAERLQQWAFNKDYLLQILPLAQQRMDTLSDFAPLAGFFASGQLSISESDFADCKLQGDELAQALQFSLWSLEALRDWQRDSIFACMKGLADSMGIKVKDFFGPLFIAISGSTTSVSVIDAMAILGPDMSRARIRHALNTVAGELGKKKLKKLEKAYNAISPG
ncbi:glutamate--tRNA ligase [Dasania marina]|uniref:glutamate--tRNA ligase n=1 Tax=Dasania marina TaxID=471499 RepID=UPI0003797F63|nr:glutamate--tRNA ligase [Dasania marina]